LAIAIILLIVYGFNSSGFVAVKFVQI